MAKYNKILFTVFKAESDNSALMREWIPGRARNDERMDYSPFFGLWTSNH